MCDFTGTIYLQEALLADSLSSKEPSLPPPHYTCRQVIDEEATAVNLRTFSSRHPKLSAAKVASLWLRSSKGRRRGWA